MDGDGAELLPTGERLDKFYRIQTGYLISQPARPDGAILTAGDFIGAFSFLSQTPLMYTYLKDPQRKMEELKLQEFDASNIRALLFSDVMASMALAKSFAKRLVHHTEMQVKYALYGKMGQPGFVPYLLDPAEKRRHDEPRVVLRPGEVMLREGDPPSDLYLVNSGQVSVTRAGVEVAQREGPGQFYGELSLLLGIKHTATVRALTECRALRITRHNLSAIIDIDPDFPRLLINMFVKRLVTAMRRSGVDV